MPIIKSVHSRFWRLHNIHLVIFPVHFYPRYYEKIKKIFPLGKYTITINKKNIELQLQRKESYNSTEIEQTMRLFKIDLEKIIKSLEKELGCEIWKKGHMNIEMVNHHMAEYKNEIAILHSDKKLKVRGEDGKIWLLIDKSLKEPEIETVDPVEAYNDGKAIDRQFNAMRGPHTPTVQDLSSAIFQTLEITKLNADSINHFGTHLKSHVTAIQELTKMSKGIRKMIRSDNFLYRPGKVLHSSQQSTLSQY